jgi:hypothetical protein
MPERVLVIGLLTILAPLVISLETVAQPSQVDNAPQTKKVTIAVTGMT